LPIKVVGGAGRNQDVAIPSEKLKEKIKKRVTTATRSRERWNEQGGKKSIMKEGGRKVFRQQSEQ